MSRIKWLDSCRGMAILLLIAIHYVSALESRNFISRDILELLQAFLRVATPFFVFTFGFTYFVANRKLIAKNSIADFYNQKLFKRLVQIFIAREIIVLISATRFPKQAENLMDILLYQSFSIGGEILTFYLIALAFAPINIWLLNKLKGQLYIVFWLVLYSCAYFIGTHFVEYQNVGLFKLLFFDVYPFFPLMTLAAFGMLAGKFYFSVESNAERVRVFLPLAAVLFVLGASGIAYLSNQPIHDLAIAAFKAPPHFFYLTLYAGVSLMLVMLLALLIERKICPDSLTYILGVIGRNTLVAYVLHYTLYLPSVLAKLYKPAVWFEILCFFLMLLVIYLFIYMWDTYKNNAKSKLIMKEVK
ncbi:acyltransferase [Catenovulum sp. 2E275]|uniref:acyltransferase n=1 Tax=Catenovulum sp. 2E275 TaxID=2980497 RepID=UPI0021D1E143|nr:acyltransferase [Catenovulum sp. 2E275]MCU4674827.1 acyltransferase [Catenovulum sp. 2E275]